MTTAEYRSRYACTDIEDYDFSCGQPDCPEVSHESNDFVKCESCAMFLCSEHALHMLNDDVTPFCVTCAQCTSKRAYCDGTAAFLCDACGAPTCWNCVQRGDGDSGYYCAACAKVYACEYCGELGGRLQVRYISYEYGADYDGNRGEWREEEIECCSLCNGRPSRTEPETCRFHAPGSLAASTQEAVCPF